MTRNGVVVGELLPLRRREFVSREVALAAFDKAPAIDARVFCDDLDVLLEDDA